MAAVMRDQCRSPGLADQLLAVLEAEDVARAIGRLAPATDPSDAEDAARRFAQFAGGAERRVAPRADAPRPEGTLTVDRLAFPRKM
jgi:hypothetical protein